MNGFVLAGGRSIRMGRDKALLAYAGRPLVEHAVALLKAAGCKPHIVGSRPDLARYAPVIPDLRAGCGPLGGMEVALAASDCEWNLFVPVDLPLLPVTFLRYLQERVALTFALATIPTLGGRPEPLCAVYHRDLQAGIKRALETGDYKVIHGVEEAAADDMDIFSVEAVVAARDGWSCDIPVHRWFQNINTPADLTLIS